MNINWAKGMINEEIKRKHSDTSYVLKQVVGVDRSSLFVARTGIRGSNALITSDVYDKLNNELKYGKDNKTMWTQMTWNEYGITVYGSTWHWTP